MDWLADTSQWDRVGLMLLVPFPAWVTGLVIAAAVAVVVLAAKNLQGTPRALRLLALRTGAVLLAVYLYLQPAVQLEQVTRVRNHLLLLVDGSASMALQDGPDGPRRADRVADLLRRSSDDLEELAADHVVDVLRFAEDVVPTSTAAVVAAPPIDGAATGILEALEAAEEPVGGEDLAAVVLLSDGADNGLLGALPRGEALPDDLAERLTALGVPVHGLVAGDPDRFTDLAVRRVTAQPFSFLRSPMQLEATLTGVGLPRGRVRVTLERDGHPERSVTADLATGTGEAIVRFDVTPDRVGRTVWSVVAEPVPGETLLDNNRRDVVVQVIRDKVRVLQVAGRPSWDERNVRRLLKRNPNVDLISFFILRTSASQQLVPNNELSLIPFPTRELFEEQLERFDAVILQDFDYRPYQMRRYLPRISSFVRRGGALVMTGGSQSFSTGGYHGTPVAELLPVTINPPGLMETMLSTDTFPVRLTEAGRRHPVTRLSPDRAENERIWQGLPALEGVNLVREVLPHGVVLAEHPFLTLPDGSNHPVVVAGEAGEGRVLTVLTDSVWRWALPAAAEGGDPRHHLRFWNNALRWLLKDPEWKRIRIQPEQDAVFPGERVRVQVSVVDRAWQPAAGVAVEVDLRPAGGGPEGVRQVHRGPANGEGRLTLEVEGPAPGAWSVQARASLDGVVEEDSAVFLVRRTPTELEDAAIREDLLRAIARTTGGEVRRLPGASLTDLERRPPRVLRVDRRRTVELWHTPWALVLAVLLLGSEWWLRRRRGLL